MPPLLPAKASQGMNCAQSVSIRILLRAAAWYLHFLKGRRHANHVIQEMK